MEPTIKVAVNFFDRFLFKSGLQKNPTEQQTTAIFFQVLRDFIATRLEHNSFLTFSFQFLN